jgi:hypothetical protein
MHVVAWGRDRREGNKLTQNEFVCIKQIKTKENPKEIFFKISHTKGSR